MATKSFLPILLLFLVPCILSQKSFSSEKKHFNDFGSLNDIKKTKGMEDISKVIEEYMGVYKDHEDKDITADCRYVYIRG